MAVDDVPTPKSIPQLLGAMVDGITSRLGIHRLRPANPILSIAETVAVAQFRQSAEQFRILQARDLDSASGVALDRRGAEAGRRRLPATPAVAVLTISDTSFTKQSSPVSAAGFAPVAGSDTVFVDNADGWPVTGTVFLGRRTPNSEGPIAYTAVANAGPYWTVTLASPTTRFHNTGEEVVVGHGGDRLVSRGTTVGVPAGALTAPVRYSLSKDATILDGETEVTGIPATCTSIGSAGRVPAGAISEFTGGVPFPGAAVTNPLPVSSGRDVETNSEYRDGIRRAEAGRQRGTDLAIENATLGVTGDDERTSTASELVRRPGRAARLYVDDGTDYEAVEAGVGVEVLVDSAAGGERDFQVNHRPIRQASLTSLNPGPYPLSDSAVLSFRVGGVTTTHVFDASEFPSISAASAYDVVSSINADGGLLWSASTGAAGTLVVVRARGETNDDVEWVPAGTGFIDAGPAFLFPVDTDAATTSLYLNDVLLSKDGYAAVLRGRPHSEWGPMSGTQTIIVKLDQQLNPNGYGITDTAFVQAGTDFTAVGVNTPEAWATVLNQTVAGVVFTVENDAIVATSARGVVAGAALEFSDGSLIAAGVLPQAAATGKPRDYSVARGTGQIVLERALVQGDRLTLGVEEPRGATTSEIGVVDFPDDTTLWVAVDGAAEVIQHGLTASLPMVTAAVATSASAVLTEFRVSIPNTDGDPWELVQAGDVAVIWDPAAPATWRKAWRVVKTTVTPAGDHNWCSLIAEVQSAADRRFHHAAAGLIDGRVLVCGGYASGGALDAGSAWIGSDTHVSAEIYDPATQSWSRTGSMATARAHHTATILPDGRVLVCGGFGPDGVELATTEIWTPGTGLWTAGPAMSATRACHTATALVSGRVLVVGGSGGGFSSAQEFNPGTNTFISPTTLGTGRRNHSAVLLPTGAGTAGAEAGNVLIVGGLTSGGTALTSMERYNAGTPGWSAKTSAPSARSFGSFVSATTQTVLFWGGGPNAATQSARWTTYAVYTVNTNAWTSDASIGSSASWIDNRDAGMAVGGVVYAPLGHGVGAYGQAARGMKFSASAWTTYDEGVNAYTCRGRSAAAAAMMGSFILLTGGVDPSSATPLPEVLAVPEIVRSTGGDVPNQLVGTATLSSRGLTILRTAAPVRSTTVPAGPSYTAESLSAAISVPGATASVYRTSRLRLRTNTVRDGDLALVADRPSTGLATEELLLSQPPSRATATARSDSGTPANFAVYHQLGGGGIGLTSLAGIVPLSFIASPLRRCPAGLNTGTWSNALVSPANQTWPTWGQAAGDEVVAGAVTAATGRPTAVTPRTAFQQPLAPSDPLVAGTAFATTGSDTTTFVVDGDTDTKRFVVNGYRRVIPTTNVYGTTITVRDADASSAALSTTFGTDYDWDDFAVLMRARAISHPAAATKSILWRYYRYGAEGEAALVRYAYPAAPSLPVSVRVSTDQADSDDLSTTGDALVLVDIVLNSGAARLNTRFHDSTRLGLARNNYASPGTSSKVADVYVIAGFSVVEAQRTSIGGTTRIRIQVPNDGTVGHGPQSSGLVAGDIVWFEAGAPTIALFSGAFAISAVGSFNAGTGQVDITAPAGALNDGTAVLALTSNPGTLSADQEGEASLDPATTAGDIAVLSGPTFANQWLTGPGRVTVAGRQYLIVRMLDTFGGGVSNPAWYHSTALSVFAGPSSTAAAIAAAVNAAAAVNDSPVPVTATVVGDSSGSGTVTMASWDELARGDFAAGYRLVDGLNAVAATVPAGAPGDDVSLVMKRPADAGLATGADWVHEDVRLCPVTTERLVQWMQTPAVTGLWTVTEVCAAGRGRRAAVTSLVAGSAGSVEVQGGTGSAATAAVVGGARIVATTNRTDSVVVAVRRGEGAGIPGGAWVGVSSTAREKPRFWSPTDTLTVGVDGSFNFTAAPFSALYDTYVSGPNIGGLRTAFTKVGRFVAVRVGRECNSEAVIAGLESATGGVESCYLWVGNPTLSAGDFATPRAGNTGVFRIVRGYVDQDEVVLWVENSAVVEEIATCSLKVLTADSVVPGDLLDVTTTAYGVATRRIWRVTSVGLSGGQQFFPGSTVITVDVADGAPVAYSGPAGTDAVVRESGSATLYKRVLTVSPNQDDASFEDIQLDTAVAADRISAAHGSVMRVLDKPEWPQGVIQGVDGYRYGRGLVGEANRVVYGDRTDEDRYPGYAAAGADIDVDVVSIRRFTCTVAIRVQGNPSEVVADRVRSAVATAVNTSGKGGFAIGEIVAAALTVPNVTAASVVSPRYDAGHDVVAVPAGSRLRVLDLRNDVRVVYVGT